MKHQIFTGAARPASLAGLSQWRRVFASPTFVVLLFALAVLALNPIGYKGGGSDDWHYLKAARCAAEHGFCLPENHWWRRFAVVIPAGLAIRFLGESAWALMLVPLACSTAALALFVRLVERQFARREALIAGLMFAATPVIGERLLEVNIDMTELLFLLGSIACLQSGHRSGRAWTFAAAGALLALAVLARPTQLALVPIFAAAFCLIPTWRRRATAAVAGFAAPLLAEAAVYAVWAGDALLPWKLSAAHTRIHSTELEKTVDLSQSPLFNVAFIDGWKPAMDLSVHWTVDGVLNLLIHPAIGLSLVAALMLLMLDWRSLRPADPRARLLLFLAGASCAFFGALVYAFAVDPKPRMFLPVLASACAIFGVLATERLRTGQRLLVFACLGLIVAKGAIASWDQLRADPGAVTAKEWLRDEPGAVSATMLTSSLLTLTPEVRALPVGAGIRPYLLAVGADDCGSVARDYPGWTVARSQTYPRREPALMQAIREKRLFLQPTRIMALCLLERPAGSMPGNALSEDRAESPRP